MTESFIIYLLKRGEYFSKEAFEKPDKSVLEILEGIPVFAGDDVAIYTLSLPESISYLDVVSSTVPPFERFFVEFQGISKTIPIPTQELYAWGCFFKSGDTILISLNPAVPALNPLLEELPSGIVNP